MQIIVAIQSTLCTPMAYEGDAAAGAPIPACSSLNGDDESAPVCPLAEGGEPNTSIAINPGDAAPADLTIVELKDPPGRVMADYGDILDEEEEEMPHPCVVPALTAEAENVGDHSDEPGKVPILRPNAIHIKGVQRLTRTHLEELFKVKSLPIFATIEWLSDEQAICVFDNAEDAAEALAGCSLGFDDAPECGPGLWRAIRGMLDFRLANGDDRPDPFFKKQHRSGRQAREYRFWAALQEQDREILDREEALEASRKRPIERKDYDDDTGDSDLHPHKRHRTVQLAGEPEGISLLERMAQMDKRLLLKDELDIPKEEFEDEGSEEEEQEEGHIRHPGGGYDDSWQVGDDGGGGGSGTWGEDDGWNERGGWDRSGGWKGHGRGARNGYQAFRWNSGGHPWRTGPYDKRGSWSKW